MGMNFSAAVLGNQRLVILQVLQQDAAGSCNENVLRVALGMAGHRSLSPLRVRDLLSWLSRQGLVALEERAGLMLARITDRGEDVALGGSSVPGVDAPGRDL